MRDRDTKTILLIEDNLAILDALTLLLEAEGYQVSQWTGGAAEHLLQYPLPDLICLDLLLSGSDGRMMCQWLKSEESTRHIPVLLMSANRETPRIATKVGADGWIMKPFEPTALLSLLCTYLERGQH